MKPKTEPKAKFIRSGKVKDIYELDAEHLLFKFTDRVSAFDVVLPTAIPRKGDVDARYFELAQRLLAATPQPPQPHGFGTHDLALVERLCTHARAAGVPCVAVGGGVDPAGIDVLGRLGVAVVAVVERPQSVETAMAAGPGPVVRCGERLARLVTMGIELA